MEDLQPTRGYGLSIDNRQSTNVLVSFPLTSRRLIHIPHRGPANPATDTHLPRGGESLPTSCRRPHRNGPRSRGNAPFSPHKECLSHRRSEDRCPAPTGERHSS